MICLCIYDIRLGMKLEVNRIKNQVLSKDQVSSCYDKLASSGKFPDGTLLHKSLLELVDSEFKESDNLDILDAGSGAGYFGLHLAGLGHHLTLVDISTESLSHARKRSHLLDPPANIKTIAGDVEHLPIQSESFDAVVCIFVFSHLINPDRAFSELKSILRNDGRLMIGFENKVWHAVAAGLREQYDEATWLMSSKEPIIKAYDILPPVRLYSIQGIRELCSKYELKINSFIGLRHLTSYQEPLKGIGTTDTEYILRDNPKAKALEQLLSDTGELLCLARHFLICASPSS